MKSLIQVGGFKAALCLIPEADLRKAIRNRGRISVVNYSLVLRAPSPFARINGRSHTTLIRLSCGGGCSSRVERLTVAQEVAGSKPVTHPIFPIVLSQAQSLRAQTTVLSRDDDALRWNPAS